MLFFITTWIQHFLALTAAAFCQITAPSPVLSSISPLGAKPGTQIQLTLRGTDLDAPLAILLGQHRLPISTIHQAKLTLPETLAPGLYDLRLVGRWGVSNPRVFEIAPTRRCQAMAPTRGEIARNLSS